MPDRDAQSTNIPPEHAPAEDHLPEVQRLLSQSARLLRAQRPKEALEVLRRAHALAPLDADVAINMGGALVMSSQWSKAVPFLERSVEHHPHNVHLWLNLAAAYLGRLEIASPAAQERAIAAYRRALDLDGSAHSAHYNVGLIYAERQDWEEAMHWFQAALQANPADGDAAVWLRRAQSARASASADDTST